MKPKYTEFVETILDSIADGVFTIDRKNVITSFNKAAERITGYTKEEAVGRFCYDIFRANICQGACALEEALQTESDVVDRQLNIINREGTTIPISVSASVLKDKNGNAIGGVETFRDLSDNMVSSTVNNFLSISSIDFLYLVMSSSRSVVL